MKRGSPLYSRQTTNACTYYQNNVCLMAESEDTMDNTTMNEEALKQRRAYYKKWRATHKEQIKTYNKRYWEKKAKESREDD